MTNEQALGLLKAVRGQLESLIAEVDVLISASSPPKAEEPTGPHCPKCGSPKFSDMSGMGKSELQCLDCATTYAA